MANRVFARNDSFLEPEVPNPFEHSLKFSRWEKLQIVLASITIAPIRILLMILFVFLTWPIAFIGTYGQEKLGKEPLTGWRRDLRGPLRRFLKLLLWAFGIPLRTKRTIGKRAHPSVAPILVIAPHVSFWDAATACMGCGLPSFVAAKGNCEIPIIGRLIDFLQPVYVVREDPNSRHNTVEEIKRRAKSGGQWPQVVIFPEGTTTNAKALITFKSGAFIPGVPVQPVLLRYPNKIDTITWTWDGPSALQCLWLTFCQFKTRVEIEFLPVYQPSDEEKNNPKLYASNVRKVMANALGVPVTDHTYDDCRLMLQSKKKYLPLKTGVIEFTKLHDKLGLSWQQASETLDKFATIARNQDGKIGLDEFASYLGLPVSPALTEVFNMYDRSSSGAIDFREYVIGLSLVSQPANSDETLKRVFQLFDKENQGFITFSQGKGILENAFGMSEDEVSRIYKEIDVNNTGKIFYEEFTAFVKSKPEYARLFLTYEQLQETNLATVTEEDRADVLDKDSADIDVLTKKDL